MRVDAGVDWLGRLGEDEADVIVLTHGHPDHAFGLQDGADCPVYATHDTWRLIRQFPIEQSRELPTRRTVDLGGIAVEAFPVEHSVNAPAVGLHIAAGRWAVFYAPDVVSILDRRAALDDVDIYIGDGSSIQRSLVRRTKRGLVGHAPVRTQLGWCEQEGVSEAVFTHCGTPIVEGDERKLGPEVRRLGRERGVNAQLAHDAQIVAVSP